MESRLSAVIYLCFITQNKIRGILAGIPSTYSTVIVSMYNETCLVSWELCLVKRGPYTVIFMVAW